MFRCGQKGFLDGILGVLLIAQDPSGGGEKKPGVAVVQVTELELFLFGVE